MKTARHSACRIAVFLEHLTISRDNRIKMQESNNHHLIIIILHCPVVFSLMQDPLPYKQRVITDNSDAVALPVP